MKDAVDLKKIIERNSERKRQKGGLSGASFAQIPAAYGSGNPTLQLPEESSATLGPKTHLALQPPGNRNMAIGASQQALVISDTDRNRLYGGRPVNVSQLVYDVEYLMGVRPVTPGNTLLLSANTERSTTSATYVEVKRFKVTRPGRYRIKGQLSRSGGTTKAVVKILLPDGTLATASAEATYSGLVYPTFGAVFTLDMTVSVDWGATIVVHLLNDSGPAQTGYISAVQLFYADATASLVPHDIVITD